MRTFLVGVLSMAMGSAMALAAPPTTAPAKAMAPKVPPLRLTPNLGVVRSCARELTVKVQIDNDELHSKYGANYNAVNLNEVKVNVYNSYISGNDLMCQYRSVNRDIPNLVYRIPCPGATPANNGYEHAYRCTN